MTIESRRSQRDVDCFAKSDQVVFTARRYTHARSLLSPRCLSACLSRWWIISTARAEEIFVRPGI